MSQKNDPELQAIAFQFDPYSDQLLAKLGRAAGQLIYSQADHPSQVQRDEYGPVALLRDSMASLIENELHGRSFGVTLRENDFGIVVAGLEIADESLQARVFREYTEWADRRSGRETSESAKRGLLLSLDGEDTEIFHQAADSPALALLSVRCLGLKVKGIAPIGRDRFQIVDGE